MPESRSIPPKFPPSLPLSSLLSCFSFFHIIVNFHSFARKNIIDPEMKIIGTFSKEENLPEWILSSTRGTAQKMLGLSSPMSSINNLTSCRLSGKQLLHLTLNIQTLETSYKKAFSPHARTQLRHHAKWIIPQSPCQRYAQEVDMRDIHPYDSPVGKRRKIS